MASCPCEWKDFTKWILPYVSSPSDEFKRPPKGVIESFIRRTAHDFAVKTGVLRKKVYYDISCGVIDYPIISVEAEDILSYKEVAINGDSLDSSQYEIIDDVLFLEEIPSCDIVEGLCIEYSYAPCTDGICDVPEDFCTRYREAILSGTLMHLLSMPNMDWYSAGESQRYSSEYQNYISRAKRDIRKRKSSRRKNIYDIKTRFIQ